jgi:peptidoglycan hydrolase-like protein with peptidoglycan-binding domain
MRRIITLVAAGVVLLPSLASATDIFTRPLRVGDVGADVLRLQQFLNQNSATQIAEVGAGSPGQESTYFGAKTKQAVIRLQELYAAEVLTPSGLSFGTGYVGEQTRRKLNSLLQGGGVSTQTMTIASLSVSVAHPGEPVVIYGYNLGSEAKTVVFDTTSLSVSMHPTNANAVIFAVPAGVVSGVHQVQLLTVSGKSSNKLKIRIVGAGAVSADLSNGPSISQLSPSRGGYGATLTIVGSGFSQLPANKVLVGAQAFTNVASPDGRTLSVVLPPLMEGLAFTPDLLEGVDVEFPLGVMVSNSLGESPVAVFNFTFYK